MFEKKYPPIVLTKAHMCAMYWMQKGLDFILADEMVRIVHMTMDSARKGSYFSVEFEMLIRLKNGKVINPTFYIDLEQKGGENWDSYYMFSQRIFTFPTKQSGHRVVFELKRIFQEEIEIGNLYWSNYIGDKVSSTSNLIETPDHPELIAVRKLLTES